MIPGLRHIASKEGSAEDVKGRKVKPCSGASLHPVAAVGATSQCL